MKPASPTRAGSAEPACGTPPRRTAAPRAPPGPPRTAARRRRRSPGSRIRPSGPLSAGDDLAPARWPGSGRRRRRPPEWRSTAVPTTSIWAYISPRRLSVMAGRLPSKNPVSLMIATSAASRSRSASSQRVEVGRARLLLALEDVLDVDGKRAAGREQRRRRPSGGRGSGPCRRPRRGRGSGRRRRPARTAARSTGRAGRPAGRRSGRRRGPSGRPGRGASRRRRPGGRRSRPTSACSRPAAVSASASHRRRARQSSACSGSAEMLGMRRNALYDSRRASLVCVEVGFEGGVGRAACPAL